MECNMEECYEDIVTVFSQNMGGETFDMDKRIEMFIFEVSSRNPDFVLTQDVHRKMYEKLCRSMNGLGYNRHCSGNILMNEKGEVMFSKFTIEDTIQIPFTPSSYNTTLEMIKVKTNLGKYLCIGNIKLRDGSSIKNHHVRTISGLKKIRNDLFGIDIILGVDTELQEYQERDFIDPAGWIDAWYEEGIDSNKYTVDGTTNALCSSHFKDRPDRIWLNSPDNNTLCVEYELVGVDHPYSSHYGIFTTFHI